MSTGNKKTCRAREGAQYLSIALSTFWLWAKQGKITPIKLSRGVTVFTYEELDNLLSSSVEA